MAERFANLPDISTIQSHRLVKYRVSEDRFSAEVLLPGLWYTDFDKKIGGKWSLWSVANTCGAIRAIGFKEGLFYTQEVFNIPDRTLFVASHSFQFSQKAHEMCYDSHYGRKYPIRAVTSASQYGTSSYTTLLQLYEHDTGVKILSVMTKVVCVNSITRKSAPFPEVLNEKFENYMKGIEVKTIEKTSVPEILPNAYQYHTKAMNSDCDLNMHVNQSVFMQWCSDAASEAARAGHFHKFNKHIELYPIKSFEIHYVGEALVNDQVVVNTWDNKETPNHLHFAIVLNGRIINFSDMAFYDGSPACVSLHLESQL